MTYKLQPTGGLNAVHVGPKREKKPSSRSPYAAEVIVKPRSSVHSDCKKKQNMDYEYGLYGYYMGYMDPQ